MPKRNVIEIVVEGDDKASHVLRNVNTQLDGIGRLATTAVVGGIAAASAAVVGFGIASLNEFNKFQQGMNEVFTLLPGISQEAMGKLENDVQKVNAEFGLLNEQTIPALYQAISAGVPSDNVVEFMSTAAQASIGGVTTLETAVDGITSVVNAYGDEAINAQQASDLMFTAVRLGKTDFDQLSRSLFQVVPTAASLGLEFGNVTAALATLTSQGTPTSVAATQLRQLMVELQKPTTKVSKLFEEMAGKSFPDFIAEGGNLADALNMIRDGASEGDVELAELFGSVEALNAFLGLTGQNAEGFANNLVEMGDSAGATEKAFETMASGMQFQLNRLKSVWQNILTNVGQALEPFAAKGIELLGNLLEGFQHIIDFLISGDIKGEMLSFFGIFEDNEILGFFLTLRNNIVSAFGAISAGVPILDIISTMLGNLFGSEAQQTFEDIRTAISDVWNEILRITAPIREWITQNVELQDVLIVIGGLIASVVIPAIAGFVAALATPIAIIGGLIVAVAALRSAWENDFGGIRTFVETQLLPALGNLADWFLNTALPAIMNFINTTVIPGLQIWVDVLTGIWDLVSPHLQSLYDWFITTGLPFIVDVIEGVVETVGIWISTMVGIWGEISGPLGSLLGNLLRIFNDIRIRVINPIISRFGELITTIRNVLTTLGLIESQAQRSANAVAAIPSNPGSAVSNSGALFGYQNGIPFVTRNQDIRVHRGEAIIPARDNPNARSNMVTNNETKNTINVTIQGSDNPNRTADEFVGALRAKGIELAR